MADALLRDHRVNSRQLAKVLDVIWDARAAATRTLGQWKSLEMTLIDAKKDFIDTQRKVFEFLAPNQEALTAEDAKYDKAMDRCTESLMHVRAMIEDLETHGQQASSQDLSQILNKLVDIQQKGGSGGSTRFPTVDLPKFDGEYCNWESFRDSFRSSIHDNNQLSKTNKLQYLKLSLTGDAAKQMQRWKITEDNYDLAWEELQKRYGKKNHIVNDCIDKFLAQMKMPKVNSLQSLKDRTLDSKKIIWELKNLGSEYYTLDSFIIHIMKTFMDEETKKSWEEKRVSCDMATVDEWFDYLDGRIDSWELWAPKETPFNDKKEKKPQTKPTVKSHHTGTGTDTIKCPKCSAAHELFQCDAFKALSFNERRRIAFFKKVCYNCLRTSHVSGKCPSTSLCLVCQGKHHTLLHRDDNNTTINQTSAAPVQQVENSVSNQNVTLHHSAIQNRVLLPTAIVKIRDLHGNPQDCRILIDTGGECTFISEACVQRLGLHRRGGRIGVTGPSEVTVAHTKGLVSIVLTSMYDPGEYITAEAYILSKLTSLFPSNKIVEPKSWQHLRSLKLADPTFSTPGTIDIILGGDYAMDINLPGILHSETGVPVAQLTIFGWILGGKIGGEATNVRSFHTTVHLDQLLGRFLDAEDVPKLKAKILTPEEQFAEEHFVENVRRDHTGRYQVRLPIKPTHMELGNSKSAALHRLRVMERKFEKDPIFHESYVEFMKEYFEMGHMELVPAAEEYIEHSKCYVIPHMAVLRPTSTTTKLRVVFDASARTKPYNVSLNDILAVGPTIQPDLVSLLLNFRPHKYAFSADVEKMYRQVVVAPVDRQYQRILWRASTHEVIQTYNLNTVTYGEGCAPFLAVRVLHQVGEDNKNDFPLASQTIQKGFYMDDLLSGAETLQEAVSLRRDVQTILAKSGFRLRKWSSNSSAILSEIPTEDLAVTPEDVEGCSKSISALGLHWSPGRDTLSLAVEGIPTASTKRELCSAAARIFDPLGIISPVTAAMKMIFQKLWLCNIEWDDCLPNSIIDEFNCIRDELDSLQSVELPRFIPKDGTQIELHGFADASEKGIGAVIYARGIDEHGNMTVRHLIAKSRVAPLKPATIPRLELCAALLLTRLFEKVKEAYCSYTITMTAWSDSSIVLFWLQHHPSRWKTYVANRSAEILDTIPTAQWRHVASGDNPADCISRGLAPKEILQHTLWWSGPHWLVEASDMWPQSLIDLPGSILTGEEKPLAIYSHLALRLPDKMNPLFFEFSNVRKLFRKVAYRLRFRRNFLGCKLSGPVSVEELNYARHHLIKIAQSECFPDELKNLRKGKQVKRSSRLCSLLPFLDSEGIIRVTGRIQNSKLGPETRHPILLFGKHPLTRRLIEDAHKTNCHAQFTVTQNIMRGRYWIISERTSIKSVLSSCIKCFFENPKVEVPLMGDLPRARVYANDVFDKVGCDFAGPIRLRTSRLRKAPIVKGYICLFVCMVTKAVHLEVVSDLSTEAFLAALDRFTGRRGHPNDLYCDNATNFLGAVHPVGGDGKTKRRQEKVVKYMSDSGTQFHFIPAYSPNFGGLWERGVRSVKTHLKRVLTDSLLTFEELQTVLIKIEGCLNSRPLCPLSPNPGDLEALTPAHFIALKRIDIPPTPNYLDKHPDRLTRWKCLQRLVQEYWSRWHTEYLTSLQQRPKWMTEKMNLEPGDLVLVKSDNFKTGSWELGRIEAVHPGSQGAVRVATVRMKGGLTTRAVNKMAKLPIDDTPEPVQEEDVELPQPGEDVP